ncbi:hypothetical protein [Geoglobus ahangari]|nr:hypothetical protein [Geoglobus ahangari]
MKMLKEDWEEGEKKCIICGKRMLEVGEICKECMEKEQEMIDIDFP